MEEIQMELMVRRDLLWMEYLPLKLEDISVEEDFVQDSE